MSDEERKALRDEVRAFTMGDLSAFMERLPRDMLTVLRTECVTLVTFLKGRLFVLLELYTKLIRAGMVRNRAAVVPICRECSGTAA
jgi:hypothetical protein